MGQAKDLDFRGFLDLLEGCEDSRREKSVWYSVSELFFVALCALMCGANNWAEMADYGRQKLDFLRLWFPFKQGAPGKDTLRRFFRSLNPHTFQAIFIEWVQSVNKNVADKMVAIDGKASRRSGDGDQNPLHLVSVFLTEARLVLGQQAVDEKSNEIKAIPEILNLLALENTLVTIDAMGCQYKIADMIVAKKGDYVLALKGNQPGLSQNIQLFINEPATKTVVYEEVNGDHGRLERRTLTVCEDVAWLRERHPKWQSLGAIIRLDTVVETKTTITKETRYYVTSLSSANPAKILRGIRGHWGIENTLHWVLDVVFQDDLNRTRKDHGPRNIATLRHVALNLIQNFKPPNDSITRFRKNLGWNNDLMQQTILNFHKVHS
jgi:predicted transposase YbfD/YdcC